MFEFCFQNINARAVSSKKRPRPYSRYKSAFHLYVSHRTMSASISFHRPWCISQLPCSLLIAENHITPQRIDEYGVSSSGSCIAWHSFSQNGAIQPTAFSGILPHTVPFKAFLIHYNSHDKSSYDAFASRSESFADFRLLTGNYLFPDCPFIFTVTQENKGFRQQPVCQNSLFSAIFPIRFFLFVLIKQFTFLKR